MREPPDWLFRASLISLPILWGIIVTVRIFIHYGITPQQIFGH